jgi:ribosome-associated heat shock protein Hsp15
MPESSNGSVRLDKWLWAARFFKTRRLAADAIKGGKVEVDGQRAKPAKEVRIGQSVSVTKGVYEFRVRVDGLSEQRGPASAAEQLYTETEESRERRELVRAQQKSVAAAVPRSEGRPDRRNRRELAEFKRQRRG